MNHVRAELVVSRPAIMRFSIVSLKNLSSLVLTPDFVSWISSVKKEVKRSTASSLSLTLKDNFPFSNSSRFIVIMFFINWSRIFQARLNIFSCPIPNRFCSFHRLSGRAWR
uniref:Uncharacterized protein n=1 Tax=Opuntia streptacantha TaxID=393608 RepID=A0A7C9EL17_OPUST